MTKYNRGVFILLLSVSSAILFLNTLPEVNSIKNVVVRVLFFPVSNLMELPQKIPFILTNRAEKLLNSVAKIEKLEKEILNIKKDYRDFNYLKMRYETLKKKLDFDEEKSLIVPATFSGNFIRSRIIMHSAYNYFTRFNIDKGTNDGVKKDSVIIEIDDERQIILGRVDEVYADFSSVVLITSVDFRCAGILSSGYRGLVRGNNNWLLKMEYISPDALIMPGDEVWTSGAGGIFPGGLFVGEVKSIEELKFSKGKKAIVSPAIFPQNLRYVYVAKR